MHFESPYRDAADFSEASCEAQYPADSFESMLAEELKQYVPRHVVISAYANACKNHDADSVDRRSADEVARRLLLLIAGGESAGHRAQASVLRWMIDDTMRLGELPFEIEQIVSACKSIARHGDIVSIRACCLLRLMSRDGRSLEEIGKQFGVTRAFVDKEYRHVQDRLGGMRGRADKSDVAREKFRQACVKRGKRKDDKAVRAWNLVPKTSSLSTLLN